MLHFLDIIITKETLEEWKIFEKQFTESFSQKTNPDTVPIQSVKDSASVDSILNNGVADSISNQEGVVDTIKASVSFINGTGGGDDTTTLICTALVIIAALALCFCFIRLYRQSWQKRASLA